MKIKEITFRPAHKEHYGGRGSRRKARIYVWINGESIMEGLVNRRTRPYTFYRNEILPMLSTWIGVDLSKLDMRWSQKAGCSCPCSPGFVDQSFRLTTDIHIEVTDDDSFVTPTFGGDIPSVVAY